MNCHRKALGKYGEALAREYMERKGFSTLECNYRASSENYDGRKGNHSSRSAASSRLENGEIDLIMRRDGVISFIEVKTRTSRSSDFGAAYEAVDTKKIRNITGCAASYLTLHPELSETADFRFDVVELYLDCSGGYPESVSVNFIADAFMAQAV